MWVFLVCVWWGWGLVRRKIVTWILKKKALTKKQGEGRRNIRIFLQNAWSQALSKEENESFYNQSTEDM